MSFISKIPFAIVIEWVCLIASILLIPKIVIPKFWKCFPFYLAMVAAVETYCLYFAKLMPVAKSNHAIYNGFFLFYFAFHIWIFSKLISLKKIKLLCTILALALITAYISEWIHQGFFFLFYRTNTLFSGIVVLLCIIYYYSLFKQEEYHDLLKDASFWFVTGCFIFYATNTAVNAFFAELVRTKINGQVSIRYAIMALLNIFMYGCWIKSFLCLKNKQTYTPA